MPQPLTAPPPARLAQALEEIVGDLLHWRQVAIEAIAAADRVRADAGARLDGLSDSVSAAVGPTETTDGAVAGVVRETDRSQRQVNEAGTSVRFRAERLERSARYVEQTVGQWRGSGGRPLQLAQLGNVVAGQADRRLCGCRSRSRALADRVASGPAIGDALASNAAEGEALTCARQAWERGASLLEGLRASSRVDATSAEGWRRTERGVTRLTGEADALRRYDQPIDREDD